MKTSIALACVAFVTAGLAATASKAASEAEQEVRHAIGTDRFAAGGRVSVNESVTGDLIAAGGELTLNAEVGGDLVVAGGNIRLAGSGSQGLYAAGGRIDIDARIARNARAAGGSISLGSAGQIAGNATFAGGEVVVRGGIGGYLQAGGGRVYLDGLVGGDVEVAGGSIELGPNARIEGRLRYTSQNEISRADGAEVKGGIERLASDEAARARFSRFGGGLGVTWSLGLLVAAALFAGMLPGLASQLGDTLRQRFGWSLLTGFIALVGIPVVALILLVTLIGAPLAVAAMAGYLALLLTGYVASGVGAGNLALRRWRPERAASTAWRIGAAAVGMFVIVLLGQLPWLGGLVGIVALLLGMGALLMQLRHQPA
jgi:cytoskeletal protein CcmA (bactofilin family)